MALVDLHTLARSDPAWLLDIEIAGRVHRVASRALTINDASGVAYRYSGGLVGGESELFDPSERAVTISIDVDWAALVAAGVAVERSPVVLRRWHGGTIDRAVVVLRGVAFDAEYGGANEPLTVSLGLKARENSLLIPLPLQRVDSSTWPVRVSSVGLPYTLETDDNIVGSAYPIIFGYPGIRPLGLLTTTAAPAVPVLMVEIDTYVSAGAPWAYTNRSRALIAGHKCNATTGVLWNLKSEATDSNTAEATCVATEYTDLLGQTVTCLDMPAGNNPGLYPPPSGGEWFAGFDLSTGGGLMGLDGSVIRGAGDVISWLMGQVRGVAFDAAEHNAQSDRLNSYKLDFYINDGVNAWDVIESIKRLLPVRQTHGQRGIFWQVLNYRSTADDAVRHIDADIGHARRVGRIHSLQTDAANEITIEYGPMAGTSDMSRRRVISGRAQEFATVWPPSTIQGESGLYSPLSPPTLPGADLGIWDTTNPTRILGDLRCAISQSICGIKPYGLSTPFVWDDATAEMIGRDIAALMALPHRSVTYSGGLEIEGLRMGDVVTITDSEVSLSAHPALVASVMPSGRLPVVELHLLTAPASTPRIP